MIPVEAMATGAVGELFDPPDGYEFTGGYLVTYELSIDTLLRRVLAPLAKAAPDEPLEVGRAAPNLTVAYERKHPGPVLPTRGIVLVRVPAEEGRPLHAKGGLLRFEPQDGRRRLLLRGWIGSANLTEGGLVTNHELILSGERTTGQPDDVVDLAVSLCAAVARASGSSRAVTPLVRGFERPHRSARALLQTVAGKTSLLERAKRPAGFDRLDIITPPFQSPGSGRSIADALERVLPDPGGSVHIYTSTPHELKAGWETAYRTAFSRTLVDALQARELEVTVHFTPELREGRRRPLHAKAYVMRGSTRSVALIGSANCTVSGLAGNNREAMAMVDMAREDADKLIEDGFERWTWTGLTIDETRLEPVDVDSRSGARDPFPDAWARFTPDPDIAEAPARARWTGGLVIEGLDPGAEISLRIADLTVQAIVDGDGRVDVAAALGASTVQLLPQHGTVTVTTSSGEAVDLVVYVDAPREWFDAMLEVRDQPPQSRSARDIHELHLLLRDLRRVRDARFNLTVTTPTGTSAVSDQLTLPIDRRFDFLAKHVAQLPRYADEALLADFLDVEMDDPRSVVALAIKQAGHEHDTDPLLAHLQAAIREREGQTT